MKSVSVIIPTYNSAKVIHACIGSILMQDYPSELIEIIVADGGSSDETINIIKKLAQKTKLIVIDNPLKTGEAGKAVGLKHSNNEIVALIDSDNILPDKNWLWRMLEPFNDLEIIATEPMEYTHRKEDGYITRYCALMGMNDPLCYFIGNYDRYNYISGKWTGHRVQSEEKSSYLKVFFKKGSAVPTIGANGFCIKREGLLKAMRTDKGMVNDYLFDIDILPHLISCSDEPVVVAKVKIGIVHIFSGNFKKFIQKQNRRVKDYLFFSKQQKRIYTWQEGKKIGILKFIFSCLFVFPLVVQTIKGYHHKPDLAWLFHPVACLATLMVYGFEMTVGRTRIKIADRSGWGQ